VAVVKNYIEQEEVKIEHVLTSIRCDKCGTESFSSDHLPAGMDPYIDTIGIHYGYGSKFDDSYHEVDLCEKCLEDIFKDGLKYKNDIQQTQQTDPSEYDGLI